MYSIIIAFLAGLLSALIIGFISGYFGLGVFIGIIIMIVTFFFLMRYFSSKLRDIFFLANAELHKQKIDKSIEILKSGYNYKNWFFLIPAQIESQIGMIYYTQRKFGDAYKSLQKSNPRIFSAYLMLIIGHIKNNKKDEALKAIPLVMKFNKKEAFVFSVAAYLFEEEFDDKLAAIDALKKGLKNIPANHNLNEHLLAIQNNKKYKMDHWGDMWLQLMLDKNAVQKLQQKYMPNRYSAAKGYYR